MPRSLKEPVWLRPHCLTQRSRDADAPCPRRSVQNRLVPPSYIDTMFSLSISGSTHSFLPQMAEPYGHCPVL